MTGFEEQRKRIDGQIAELRQMLDGDSTDDASPGPTKGRGKMSAAARARIAAAQRKRWAESKKASGGASKVGAGAREEETATKRGWKEGDYPGDETAVGRGEEGSGEMMLAPG